jgi:virginiamycin B lyase
LSTRSVAAILCAVAGPLTASAAYAVTDSVVSVQHPIAELPIVDRVKIPVGPGWLEAAYGSLWVLEIEHRTLLRIDPLTNRVVRSIPTGAGSDPQLAIGVGLGALWIADFKSQAILKVDPQTNLLVGRFPVKMAKDPEGSMAVGDGSVWVMTDEGGTDSGTLTRIDAVSGELKSHIKVGPKSHAALYAFESVWVTSSEAGTVTRIDGRTETATAEIAVHAQPRFLVASEAAVWVLSQGDGTVARIDPATNRVVATVDVGVPGEGGDLSVGQGYLWVSAERRPLSQIDMSANRMTRQFVGGRKDDTMRVAFGSAWVLSERQGQVWRVDLHEMAGGS